jgi:hypothetical protein
MMHKGTSSSYLFIYFLIFAAENGLVQIFLLETNLFCRDQLAVGG